MGHARRHDDVGGAGDRRFVEEHAGALEPIGRTGLEKAGLAVVGKGRAEGFEPDEVGVHAAAADFVATRLGQCAHTKTRQQRPQNHGRAAQGSTLLPEFFGAEVVEVDVVRLETVSPGSFALDFDTHARQQVNQLVDIDDVGEVGDGDGLRRQEHRTQNLQRLVFSSLRDDFTRQPLPSFDDKTGHGRLS